MRILVVDDERAFAEVLAAGLTAEGFVVDTAHDGRAGYLLAATGAYAAIVLDLMMPGMSGYRMCSRLRAEGVSTPVIVLTAKDGDDDEIEALEGGADDYLRKPFRYPVLVARLRSLLRRPAARTNSVLTVGDLVLDPSRHEVSRSGVKIELSVKEHAILDVLARASGTVVSKPTLLLEVWPGEPDDVNLVEARISALRRKIDTPFLRRSLQTIRGAGYRLIDDRAQAQQRMQAMIIGRKRSPASITTRIATAAGLLAVLLLTAGAIGIRATIYSTQLEATQQLAAAEAKQITDALLGGAQLYGPFGSLPYVLLRSDGAVIASSSEDDLARMPPPPADAPQKSAETWHVDSADGYGARTAVSSTLRASSMTGIAENDLPGGPAPRDSTVYRAYVFVSPSAADRVVATLDPFLTAGVAVTVALIGASAAISAKRALRPVEQMRAVAAEVSDAPHGARVQVPEARDELRALATTLNGMLARVDAAASHQKRFIADAAHELRNPLNTMLATVEIARKHPGALPPDRTLATVEAQARRLADLAEDLLDLAAAGTRSTQVGTSDVIEVTRKVLAERQTRVPVTMSASVDPVLAAISPNALARVIENLVDNAIRYATTGVDLLIQTDPLGGTVRIAVSNDGAPLAVEDRDRIFEPFVRLDQSRTRDTGGTGLGLAISRELIERVGGSIQATSAGPCTTFTVLLPCS